LFLAPSTPSFITTKITNPLPLYLGIRQKAHIHVRVSSSVEPRGVREEARRGNWMS